MWADRLGPETITSPLGKSPATRARSSSRSASTRSSGTTLTCTSGRSECARGSCGEAASTTLPGSASAYRALDTVDPGISGTTR